MAEHPIEEVGEKLRAMMPWIKEKALVDKAQELSAPWRRLRLITEKRTRRRTGAFFCLSRSGAGSRV